MALANSYFAQSQLNKAADVIHKLKGQAANIGALKLTAVCRALEMSALQEQVDQVKEKFQAVTRENTILLTAIQAYLLECQDE